jgi:hypothetical protein
LEIFGPTAIPFDEDERRAKLALAIERLSEYFDDFQAEESSSMIDADWKIRKLSQHSWRAYSSVIRAMPRCRGLSWRFRDSLAMYFFAALQPKLSRCSSGTGSHHGPAVAALVTCPARSECVGRAVHVPK